MSNIIQTNGSPEDNIVLFEIGSGGTMRGTNLNPTELAAKSAQALEKAMGTIQALASRTTDTVSKLPKKPQEFELEFGIKISAEAGALVSKAGGEGNLRVRMVWKDQD